MTDIRKEVHEEIDRMFDAHVVDLTKLLACSASPLAIRLNAPESDELETEDASRLVAESLAWLRQNPD